VAEKAKPHERSKSSIPHGRCDGKSKRTGEQCKKPAGWGTDHVGAGKCRIHGGSTPIKHGRYSQIVRPEMREKIERFEQDPDPLNLEPEVAILRAHVEELMNRWDEIYGPDGALLAWHNSFRDDQSTAEPKPRHLPDFSAITMVVDKVGKMVERIHKMKNEGSISMQTLNRLTEQMGADLVAAVNETGIPQNKADKLLKSVEERWNSIRLDPGTGSRQGNS
jgi:hypothetical protein